MNPEDYRARRLGCLILVLSAVACYGVYSVLLLMVAWLWGVL
jgi:hypothetical protein